MQAMIEILLFSFELSFDLHLSNCVNILIAIIIFLSVKPLMREGTKVLCFIIVLCKINIVLIMLEP